MSLRTALELGELQARGERSPLGRTVQKEGVSDERMLQRAGKGDRGDFSCQILNHVAAFSVFVHVGQEQRDTEKLG